MRKLFLIICLCIASCASAQQNISVRVDGTGANLELAKKDAFTNAIEFALGTLVVSERESNKFKIIKDEILVYSAGYVNDYKIIEKRHFDNKVYIVVDVNVSSNKINQRILAKSNNNVVFDGQKHQDQYNSYREERNKSDLVLRNILNDYHRYAFVIDQYNYRIKVNSQRNGLINIPYKLSWNSNYLTSLKSALNLIEDGNRGFLQNSVASIHFVGTKEPRNILTGTSHYKFNDMETFDLVRNSLIDINELKIKIDLLNSDSNSIVHFCYTPKYVDGANQAFFNINESTSVKIHDRTIEQGEIIININHYKLQNIINEIYMIKLLIVKENDC